METRAAFWPATAHTGPSKLFENDGLQRLTEKCLRTQAVVHRHQEIESIRKDYIAKYGGPSPLGEFYDALLRVDSIPRALVRELLFALRAEEVAAAKR